METYMDAKQGYDWTISYPLALQVFTQTEWFKDWFMAVISLIQQCQTVTMIELLQVKGLQLDLESAKAQVTEEQAMLLRKWKPRVPTPNELRDPQVSVTEQRDPSV